MEESKCKCQSLISQHTHTVYLARRVLTALKALDEVLALLLAASTHALLLLSISVLVVSLGRSLLLLGGCGAATTEEHIGEAVAHGGTDSDTSGGRSHLTKETRAGRLLSGRRVGCVSLRRLLVVLLRRSGHGVSTARARGGGTRGSGTGGTGGST